MTLTGNDPRRAEILASLHAAVRAFQQEERHRRLRRGTVQPRTRRAETAIYDDGAARREKRLARRRARAAAARAERIGPVVDLDGRDVT